MGERKGKHTVRLSGRTSPTCRDLKKSDLGGVIFGCTHATMDECLRKQLFGLPSFHFQYVENIEPGMPLFLFNYSDRLLYGIYEAASHGQMDIDLNAWTKNGTGRTGYPSQVRIRTRIQCLPLNEKQYSEIIKNNYHTKRHFWFELDHAQTEGLIALYQSSLVIHRNIPVPSPSRRKETASEADCSPDKSEHQESASGSDITWSEENVQGSPSGTACPHLDGENRTVFDHLSDAEGFEFVLQSLQKLQNEKADCPSPEVLTNGDDTQGVEESYRLEPEPYVLDEDKKKVDEPSTGLHEESRLKESSVAEIEDNTISGVSSHGNAELVRIIKVLKEKTETLEKKQVESAVKLQQLRNESGKAIEELKARVKELESKQTIVDKSPDTFAKGYLGSEKAIYLFGGYDGSTWLSSLDCFSPSVNIVKPLKSTSLVCSCASAAALNGNLYVLGGRDRDGSSWFNTVQCYSPKDDQWTLSPSLIRPKANLAGATIDGKIYAIGGSDEYTCLSDVEMYDPALGRWTNIQPMLQKRYSPAAAELHGVLYAVGGYDGQYYLQSVERYDPRVAYWTSLPSMKTDRGGHSLAVLGDKLYAIGGHNGKEIVSSVEIFDPRVGTWMMGVPMSFARVYSAAAVLDNSIFVIGGMLDNEHLLDTMECYKEGIGWTVTDFQSIGKRAFFSATVL